MDIPDKLDPIPRFNWGVLPKWVLDFGTISPSDDCPSGLIVMTARLPNGELIHVDAYPTEFDEGFGERYVRPMVENLANGIFEAEHPDIYVDLIVRQYKGVDLNNQERAIIARRAELLPCPPIPNAFVD